MLVRLKHNIGTGLPAGAVCEVVKFFPSSNRKHCVYRIKRVLFGGDAGTTSLLHLVKSDGFEVLDDASEAET